jgi:hypothetical protein
MLNERWDTIDKEREENRKEASSKASSDLEEYVFVPLVNDVVYKYNEQTLSLIKNDTVIIKINISNKPKHITKIKYTDYNGTNIYNIVDLIGYGVDENSLGLVHTLDQCDIVKGILINGEIKQYGKDLSKQEIIFPKSEVMSKLYLIRVLKVDLSNDIKINLMVEKKPVRKTKYRSLEEIDKKKIKGIIDLLYGNKNDRDIDSLVDSLRYMISYHRVE